MKGKHFFVGALVCTVLLLGAAAAFVAWVDPTLSKGLEEDGTALFVNERYEMAGLIRSQPYTTLVMGTSLVANYRSSWFEEELGVDTLKVTFPDGWLTEFDAALDLAFQTHPELDVVYFGLDPNILIRPDSQRTVELPGYLYNQNPLDDVELYLSADAVSMAARTLWARRSGVAVSLDNAYIWDGGAVFSREMALQNYARPEVSGAALPEDAYLAAAKENLDVICAWIERHPDVQFNIWFPPYSILYWDKMVREGAADAVIAAVEYASRRLMAYDNAALYTFLVAYDRITDLDNYTDHIHCSGIMSAWVAWNMMRGYWQVTEENCQAALDELRWFVRTYDYEVIFEA